MKTSDFDYDLPSELIAQSPIEPRDSSRLLVLDRKSGKITHSIFREIQDFLSPDDLLIINETRVLPARLSVRKIPGGGRAEILLLRAIDPKTWEVIVGGKGLKNGIRLQVEKGPVVTILESLEGPRRIVEFSEPTETFLFSAGQVPLPPYIHEPLSDPERYQTVYARIQGSAAAPTAGLHFTPGLIQSLMKYGIRFEEVILHVGLDTFSPVNEENPEDHLIHTEWCQVPESTVGEIRTTKQRGGKVVAVGTTSVRALESAARSANADEIIKSYEGQTDLYILPGYAFRVVDKLITNFHLPRSTLLMLVSAFAGREMILHAYEEAKSQGYRFYSFGDAMLII